MFSAETRWPDLRGCELARARETNVAQERTGVHASDDSIRTNSHTVETARTNLIEALELFFESADPTEVARRLHGEVFITRVEVAVG